MARKPLTRKEIEKRLNSLGEGDMTYFSFINGWGRRAAIQVRREGNRFVTQGIGRNASWWDRETPMTFAEAVDHLLRNKVFDWR